MTSAPFASARAQQRARLIKIIHTGRRALGMDEDTYRDLLAAKSDGKRSAKDLTIAQLQMVEQHMRASGFKTVKPASAKPRESRKLHTSDESSKARALWLWLHALGIVRDPSEAALAAFVRRTAGVDDLRWTRRPDKVIEGIKIWSARHIPAVLAARFDRMQSAGEVIGAASAEQLVRFVSPTLNPSSFNALQRAWEYLDEIETQQASAAPVATSQQ